MPCVDYCLDVENDYTTLYYVYIPAHYCWGIHVDSFNILDKSNIQMLCFGTYMYIHVYTYMCHIFV